MENSYRTKQIDLRWLLALGAALGTFLLVFVPSDRWLNGAGEPGEILMATLLKLLLTAALLLIVPSLWARLAHRISPWVLLFMAGFAYGCALLLSGNALDAVYAALPAVLPGAGLYALQKLKLSNFRTVLYESFVILAALFGAACLKDLIQNGDAYRSVKEILDLYGQSLNQLEAELAAIGASQLTETARESIALLRMSAETVAVPMLLTASMFAGLSNTLFSHLLNRRGGAVLKDLPRFEDWRCERWYVILIAALMLATILLRMFGVQSAEGLSSVAEVLWRFPCALAGLCALRKLGVNTHKGWIFWIAIAMLLTLPPIALLLLTVVGMMASLRTKGNVGEDGGQK